MQQRIQSATKRFDAGQQGKGKKSKTLSTSQSEFYKSGRSGGPLTHTRIHHKERKKVADVEALLKEASLPLKYYSSLLHSKSC